MNNSILSEMWKKYILLAVETLESPKSGSITKWVNDKAKSKGLAIGLRGVRKKLSKLRAEGLVSKNSYDEYSLIEIENKDSPPLSKLYEQILPKLKEQLKKQVYTTAYLGNGQWIAAPVRRQGIPNIFGGPIIFGNPTVSRRD